MLQNETCFFCCLQIIVRHLGISVIYNSRYHSQERNRIFTLSEHCDYSQTDIANIVGVSQKSVSRIIKQQESTDSIDFLINFIDMEH